jgi:hydroxycarboxylate dehydrogenase B
MMKHFRADYLRQFGTDFFAACGSPRSEAALVADHLVESNLMGYDSHGMMRCIEYYRCVKDGRVKPGAPIAILRESPSTAVVDCGLNFGPVSTQVIVDLGCEKAKKCGISCVLSKNSFHVGRLGSYVQKVAERGMFGYLSCNSRQKAHVAVPFGGREGRLGTNPLAFAAPTKSRPVVLDMSTCMIAAGKIDMALFEGKQLPEGCIQDAEGNPTTDPHDFYGPHGELQGTMLPLGSPRFGYKGYGLSMMIEILGGILGGEDASVDHNRSNGVSLIVIDPDHFCGVDLFAELVDRFCAYQMSSKPAQGFEEVVVPGTYDFRALEKRLAEGIPIDERIWNQLVEVAAEIGVTPVAP